MSLKTEYLDAPGKIVEREMLKTQKGISLCAFLENAGANAFAKLVSCHRTENPASDVVIVSIKVERPQRCVNPIRREEMLALQFWDSDHAYPEVLALRKDFPQVPHTNLRLNEFPRSLCLYDEPYEQVKHSWTPARFIAKLRMWLGKTATGTLHGEDQPLEPLLIGCSVRLVLPADFLDVQAERDQIFGIYCPESENGELTFIANWQIPNKGNSKYAAVVLKTAVMRHGVIRSQPQNLSQLHEFCIEAELDLQASLAQKLKSWFVDKPDAGILNCRLIIILFLPKSRTESSSPESIERWAFLSGKSIKEIGVALGICGVEGGKPGLVIGEIKGNDSALKDISIGALHVTQMLSPKTAAEMNGNSHVAANMVAIGAGAFGSQVLVNLVRSGYGKWSIVDDDVLLPHNLSRHALSAWAIGWNKATAVAQMANEIILPNRSGDKIATPIPANILSPGRYADQLASSFKGARMIVDLSASISVSRFLSDAKEKARSVSAFITPPGSSLVILSEDKKRKYRLDWLEMLHYRAVLNEVSLADTIKRENDRVRYGNACRDLSLTISQDAVASWSAQTAHSIKSLSEETAAIQIFAKTEDGGVRLHSPEIHPIQQTLFGDWIIRFDKWTIKKMADLRRSKLPSETGGILLGNFDTQRQICSIIDVLPAPPDSQEWPTSYVRGCKGLREKVSEAESATAGQISYAGEWHSHPRGASVLPSTHDWSAYQWLTEHMAIEGLPGLMMIIGDYNHWCFVGSEPETGSRRLQRG